MKNNLWTSLTGCKEIYYDLHIWPCHPLPKAVFMWSMNQKGIRGEYTCSGQRYFALSFMTDHWPRNFSQGHCMHTLWPKAFCKWSASQNGPREENIDPTKNFSQFCCDLNLQSRNLVQGRYTSFNLRRHYVGEVCARLDWGLKR